MMAAAAMLAVSMTACASAPANTVHSAKALARGLSAKRGLEYGTSKGSCDDEVCTTVNEGVVEETRAAMSSRARSKSTPSWAPHFEARWLSVKSLSLTNWPKPADLR